VRTQGPEADSAQETVQTTRYTRNSALPGHDWWR
jgi:hypothetical protein